MSLRHLKAFHKVYALNKGGTGGCRLCSMPVPFIRLLTIITISFYSLPAMPVENEYIKGYPGAGEMILTATLTLSAGAIDIWGHSKNVTPSEETGTLDFRINAHYGPPDKKIETAGDVFYWSSLALPSAYYGLRLLLCNGQARPFYARALLTWWQGFCAIYFATQAAKVTVRRPRPNGEDSGSFFSGHSSLTFYSASFFSACIGDALYSSRLNRTITGILAWGIVPGILHGTAAFTAWSRIRNHYHYFSDIVTGAIAGTCAGIITWYFFYPRNAKRGRKVSLLPLFSPQRKGLAFQMVF